MDAVYDTIGKRYTSKRQTDPRIYQQLREAIGDARRILNAGAGTGSYEPPELEVVALEPSSTMLAQRAPDAAPAVQGRVEQLPFPDNSFDLAMGVLTLHHWSDQQRGLEELARVASGNVMLLTWFAVRDSFWLTDYFPAIIHLDRGNFPDLAFYESVLGPVEVTDIPIPHDCQDGFLCAYWRRPEAYLDPEVRNAISTFSMMRNEAVGLEKLAGDLQSGAWEAKYGELLTMDSCDFGYRLLRSQNS